MVNFKFSSTIQSFVDGGIWVGSFFFYYYFFKLLLFVMTIN